ncbi:MAG TPA: peptidase, partial [Gemmatimonadales bacterium]
RGSEDSWTTTPKELDAVTAAARQAEGGQRQETPPPQFGGGGTDRKLFDQILRDPARRDPRGYVIPASQPDFPTATKFVNALIKSGVDVHRATSAFSAGGKQYQAGSYVVKTAQAFRPHVLDMFEPQDYPNDLQYPGGPPKAPYDNAGYTLAMSMGVVYDRILDPFDGPFEKVPDLLAKAPGGAVAGGGGWLLSGRYNDAITAVNRLLAAKVSVSRLGRDAVGYPAGSFYIPGGGAKAVVDRLAEEKGLRFESASSPGTAAVPLKPVRVALWDQYGGSMPSGWIRWLLEQMEVPFTVVYPGRLDAGDLRKDFDVLIFPDGGIPAPQGGVAMGAFGRQPAADEIPAEYRDRLGRVTAEKTVPQLKAFLEAGGRIVAIGSSTALARHLDLPVTSHLVERTSGGQVRNLPRDKFYVPASLLEVAVDTTAAVAWGMPSKSLVLFDESPVFDLDPGAIVSGQVKPIAWFASAQPLRSGWAWGQAYLEGGIAAAEAKVGRGTLYLFGPEITFRAQPHGTFKLLFNAIMNAGM